jgi:hypothetical protein
MSTTGTRKLVSTTLDTHFGVQVEERRKTQMEKWMAKGKLNDHDVDHDEDEDEVEIRTTPVPSTDTLSGTECSTVQGKESNKITHSPTMASSSLPARGAGFSELDAFVEHHSLDREYLIEECSVQDLKRILRRSECDYLTGDLRLLLIREWNMERKSLLGAENERTMHL